jgi:hypothetical protein
MNRKIFMHVAKVYRASGLSRQCGYEIGMSEVLTKSASELQKLNRAGNLGVLLFFYSDDLDPAMLSFPRLLTLARTMSIGLA